MKQIILFISLSFFIATSVYATAYKESEHYQILNTSTEQVTKDKIEVREFFSFICPGCYLVEKELKDWKKALSNKVNFIRTPIVLSKSMTDQVKAFYIAKHFNVEEKFVDEIYLQIHQNRKPMIDKKELQELLVSLGIEKNDAEAAFDSIALNLQMEADKAYQLEHKIYQIPVFIINNRYKVDAQMAKGDNKELFSIINFTMSKIQRDK